MEARAEMSSSPGANNTIVDEIVYLSSLVSQPQQIDTLLDDMRIITARTSPTEVSAADQQRLQTVRDRVIDYLLRREPVRSFTEEQLQQQLYEHFGGRRTVRRLHVAAGILGTAIAGAGAAAYFVPLNLAEELRYELVTVSVLMATYLTAAAFFVMSLATFSQTLRRSYGIIALGLCISGVALLQEPVLLIMHITDTLWVAAGGAVLPHVVAYALVYAGLRSFARVLAIRDIALSLGWLGGSLLMAVVVAVVAPHAETGMRELYFDAAAALTLMIAVMAGFASKVMYSIWHNSSELYRPAMKWLFWALAVTAYASLQFFVGRLIVGQVDGVSASIIMFPFIISAVLLFKAGYSFSKLARQ